MRLGPAARRHHPRRRDAARLVPSQARPLQGASLRPRHDEFPTTVTGNVQKFRMREAGIEELSLEHAVGIVTA